MQRKETRELISQLGGSVPLARALGISRQAVQQWELIPPHLAPRISELYGIGLRKLRPDLYTEGVTLDGRGAV